MNSNQQGRQGRFKATAAPLLHAQIDINASVPTVWSLITDFRRMPQWSPQCRMMKMRGPLRPGARTININRRNLQFWPTTCTITEVIPQQKVAFRVDINGLIWSYELQPMEQGTRVIESRHAENGAKPVANFAVNAFFGGVPNFERELVEGMNASLTRIKAAAEGG
jgi:uncharacterized protein YndB with AHSA1/START domain